MIITFSKKAIMQCKKRLQDNPPTRPPIKHHPERSGSSKKEIDQSLSAISRIFQCV